MAKADKYAMADSAMRVKVTASDKAVPTPATPKPAGDNRGDQNNNKHKADQKDSRSNNKLVASVEGETSAPQAGPPRKRSNRNNSNWLPRQSFEQLLNAPCKIHSGAQPSTHTLRQCSFARRLSQGDSLPAPPSHADSNSGTGRAHGASIVGSTSYAGYNSCAGYAGHADSNSGTAYNNNSGSALPRILSSRHPVGGRHGGRRQASCRSNTKDTSSQVHDRCSIELGGCRSP
ncbi:hypothetical protein D1007_12876 [Hordeum vulgare]|nr:hypothetical protein D1007_12876 [Hordeum vulgare]